MRKNVFSVMLLGAMCAGLVACKSEEEPKMPETTDFASDKVFVGAVTFNKNVNQFPITNKLDKVKEFIGNQTNESDGTPLCYSMVKGVHLFDESSLPDFDHIFMLSFTDGKDNTSPDFWLDEGVVTYEEEVYKKAKSELAKYPQLHSYTIGFGTNQSDFSESMATLVQGNGKYYGAKTQNELMPTFNQIAKSMLSSAKNVKLQTLSSNFSQAKPKKFRFAFAAQGVNAKDTIEANLVGNKLDGFVFTVVKRGKYAEFNNNGAVKGVHNEETGKVEIPLNNMKFVYNGEEQKFDVQILVYNYNSDTWSVEEEESSISESVSNRIGVVVVLDCSRSMGSAFESMQQAAISFVETLKNTTAESYSVPTYTVTLSVNDEKRGCVSGAGKYEEFETVTITATPKLSYCKFANWSDGVTTNPRTISVTKNIALTANFVSDQSCTKNGHEAIDLDLPSGLLWASCNIGATKPEQIGTYYSWGTTSPYDIYDTYLITYNVLPLSKDAANATWGGAWRMPTKNEYQELIDNCTWTSTTKNSASGFEAKSKKNGRSIFFPATGCYFGNRGFDSSTTGHYWASTNIDKTIAYFCYMSDNVEMDEHSGCHNWGKAVRGVCEK